MKQQLTPRQVAKAIGVSESSLKRWCDRGTIATVKTAGGHRRLPVASVLQFLRDSGHQLADPSILGLPSSTGTGDWTMQRGREHLAAALASGDEEQARQVLFDLYLARHSLSSIGDQVIAGAFADLGDAWSCGDLQIYQERRACELCLRVLHEIRGALPQVSPQFVAVGGTIEGDFYMLPTTLVELALRERGWRACTLGSSLPAETLAAAIRDIRPRLFWLSVSFIADRQRFLERFPVIERAANEAKTALVVGGKALDEPTRRELRYSSFCDNLQHLEAFANSLLAQPEPTVPPHSQEGEQR